MPEPLQEIEQGIGDFGKRHGVGNLEKVLLPNEEYEAFAIILNQKYPHIHFTGDDLDGRIFVQKDPN